VEPLTWLQIAALVAKYGLPWVEKIIHNAQNNVPVTVEEWNSLKKCVPFDVLVPKREP
jgi:hypothetical protein